MWKTVILLIVSLILVPYIAFYYDEALTPLQNEVLYTLVITYLFSALLCFVVSTLTKNYSQVDKLWSIMPIVYCWIVAFAGDFEMRLTIMATLATIWGVRLSWNFWRRGGYQWKFWLGDEDYRWKILQERKEFQGKGVWILFNLFFISLYQMGLILLISLPILKSINGASVSLWDYILSIVFILAVVIETIADNQQWEYQKEKYRRIAASETLGESYQKGFLNYGLWGVVRHPNYAAEQMVWILFYLFSVVATGHWINWSMVGCLLLMVLFKGSSDFSEKISASKYPAYKDYQDRVGRFFPKLF